MILSFTLSMPNNNAWNGRWSGEDRQYVRIVNVGRSQKAAKRAAALIGSHRYSFGDGWVAAVTVKEVDRAQATKLRKVSAGFCGYDWMIASIQTHAAILNDNDRRQLVREIEPAKGAGT